MNIIRIITGTFFCALIFTFSSCSNESKQAETSSAEMGAENSDETKNQNNNQEADSQFDIEKIPVSDVDLGEFPYLSFPEGLENQNKPVQKSIDVLFFPLDGVMTPLEGKTWKTNVSKTRDNQEDWSQLYFEKSYDDAITALGGVKIFDGKITKEEYDRYKDQASYLGEDGSIGYPEQNIKVYVIRRSNGDDIYIQLTGNVAGGYLDVLQKNPSK